MEQTGKWAGRTYVARAAVVAGLLAGLAGAGYGWLFAGLPAIEDLERGLHTPSIWVTDRQGRLLYEVIGDGEGRNTVVPLASIPRACVDATIATEDSRFYTNPGVDARSIVRALWTNLRGGEVLAGGSTITQQVARNLLLSPEERSERTLRRKLRESLLAYRLARRLPKDEILSLYLNQTYYGNLAYGMDAAARAYFGKPVSGLGIAECALLAGLPQSPVAYDPLTDPQAARDRQAVVLGLMARQGYLRPDQVEVAIAEPLAFASERYNILAPHFVTTAYSRLETILPPEQIAQGGLTVRTTLDLDWQRQAERIISRQLDLLNTAQPGEIPANATNAALVALDPQTGQVLALVGSAGYDNPAISGAINMALSPRQPGSTLKPFTYAAAFDPNRPDPWTAATMILDVKTSFVTREGFAYTPVNYDLEEHGPVLVREALASSYNIPAVIALDAIGLDTLFDLLARLGIRTLTDPDRYDLALTLGGGDVRLLELTAAYAGLATGGQQVNPVLILDVTDADGNIVYVTPGGSGGQVIDRRVAWLITDILSDNTARTPGFSSHSVLQIGRPAAVKTGTTTDFRDNWTVGYTPELVVGVWVGNSNNTAMINVSGVSGAGPIWHRFMRTILRGRPERPFIRPDGLTEVEICSLSGLLPTPDCPYTRREWFIKGTEPEIPDTFYRRIGDRLLLDLPPAAHAWARDEGLPLLSDPVGPSAAPVPDAGLAILSPADRAVYRIDAALLLSAQRIRIVAAGAAGTRDVTLILDGEPLATRPGPPFETWWVLEAGRHTLYAEGRDREGQPVRSAVLTFTVNPPP